jgi:hypothetical protein
MGLKKSGKPNFIISYEIEMNTDQEDVLNELLSYLQYTKKIDQFRMIQKRDITAEEEQSSKPSRAAKTEINIDAKVQAKLEAKVDENIFELIKKWKNDNSLIRLTAVKSKGVRLNIACKILNFDESSGNLSVYDVDSKTVELVDMNEIEDLQAAKK